ncbi:hypothetical protein [Pedobacter sp. Leaf170]|uniref:hypothetical protein n=1 Tax=Pedobacter sp. Leaf170 TaxID=2876558 RepID=UPI001E3D180A|nr:hypothetical protein [Pedobacter sp. Leaf170]
MDILFTKSAGFHLMIIGFVISKILPIVLLVWLLNKFDNEFITKSLLYTVGYLVAAVASWFIGNKILRFGLFLLNKSKRMQLKYDLHQNRQL